MLTQWRWRQAEGHGPGSEIFKQETVRSYAQRLSLDVLVETGTYFGAMIEASLGSFRKIYSIELDRDLYQRATEIFGRYPHVTLRHGDSAQVLPEILSELDEPAVFWLDAHYSGGVTALGPKPTPIVEELQHILDHKVREHVILIDDARDFTGGSYPSLSKLNRLFSEARPDWIMEVESDIIRIHRKLDDE